MSIEKDKKINEGLFNKVVDFVFFGGIDKAVEKAAKDVKKEDPEAYENMASSIDKGQQAVKNMNDRMEKFCKEHPTSELCKKYREHGKIKTNYKL